MYERRLDQTAGVRGMVYATPTVCGYNQPWVKSLTDSLLFIQDLLNIALYHIIGLQLSLTCAASIGGRWGIQRLSKNINTSPLAMADNFGYSEAGPKLSSLGTQYAQAYITTCHEDFSISAELFN